MKEMMFAFEYKLQITVCIQVLYFPYVIAGTLYYKILVILSSHSFMLLVYLEITLIKNTAFPNVGTRPFPYPDISFGSPEIPDL